MISKFNVPNPCSESWNGMQPKENGRYCDSCQKVVLDLTNKTNEEISAIIAANAGKKLCGTFRTSQLAPAPPPAGPDKRTIRFLAAALLVFGMTLFSCNNSDPNMPSAIQTPPDTIPLPPQAPNANDPYFLIPEPGREKENEKENENDEEKKAAAEKEYPVPEIINEGGPFSTVTGDIETDPAAVHNDVIPVAIEPKPVADNALVVGMIVSPTPEFPGGEKALREYLNNTLHTPPGDAEGTVYINFTVKTDGSIANVKLLRGVTPELDEEALRAVRSMPKWKPALQNGNAVDAQFNIPIRFHRR